MNLYKCITLCGALLLTTLKGVACWSGWYSPQEYYMYRVCDTQEGNSLEESSYFNGTRRNCKEWQAMTSETIPLEDIYQAVYKMDYQAFLDVYDNPKKRQENKFLEWITKKDRTILSFLYLAKNNEFIRLKRNSRWYYPTMKTGARMTLEEVVEKSLSATDKRLRDRYLLQAVRGMVSMGEYERCIQLWNEEICHLPADNYMRKLILPYIAGAEFHVNNSENAVKYFAEVGDFKSMLYCLQREGEPLTEFERLELLCGYAPNSKVVVEFLQKYMRHQETIGMLGGESPSPYSPERERLIALCLEMGGNKKVENPAMWFYTAAFLAYKEDDINRAHSLLKRAEKSKSTPFVKESIKVFRIFLDAKRMTYNAAYDNHLLGQLKWLDTQIRNNLTEHVRTETAQGWKLITCTGYYYWNDVMRKILLTEVCPRMLKVGKTTRALQLANMADNLLLGYVNQVEVSYYYREFNDTIYNLTDYRYSKIFNNFDYSNHFFEMIDSMDVNATLKYVQQVEKPMSEFDRFVNARGYVGADYLNDILGTQYLRNMRYREALECLEKVSHKYQSHLNVSLNYAPFSVAPKRIAKQEDFKYEFAREMVSLEQVMALTKNPNRKALLTVKYLTGIRNSFDRCWPLTQYYRGTSYWGAVCEKRNWEEDAYTNRAKKRTQKLLTQACNMVTDDEAGAAIQYMLCNFKTLAKKYPNTEKGKLVRGQCDNLCDHHLEARWEKRMTDYW